VGHCSGVQEFSSPLVGLPAEQKKELVRFLTARLQSLEVTHRARLVAGPNGTRLLEAPPGAPPAHDHRKRQAHA